MKRILNTLLLLIGLSVVSVGVIYFIYPGVLLNSVQSMSANSAGLSYRSVEIEGSEYHYLEGGSSKQTTLVLLHDLGEDKHSFIASVRDLTQEFRVVLPDLAAHGSNRYLQSSDFSISGQSQFISALLKKINANRFVIGGNGLGGHIAVDLSVNNLENIEGLILINSNGFKINQTSKYRSLPLSVNLGLMQSDFDSLYVIPPAYPQPLLQHLVNQRNLSLPALRDISMQLNQDASDSIETQLHKINVPSLIIWGTKDPYLPKSIGQKFDSLLPNSNLRLIENVGHFPQFEVPEEIQIELNSFMQKGNKQ